jgi:hypothetical protein
VALRNLLRAVRLVRSLVGPDKQPVVDDALAAFDADVPDAVNIRNVLEHFDSYLQGKGMLQQGGDPSRAVIWTASTGPSSYSLQVTTDGHSGPMALDIEVDRASALGLFNAAVDAVHGD